MGTVSLTVSDPDRSRTFYETVLGLRARALGERSGDLGFGVAGDAPLVVVRGDPAAAPLDPRGPGLFHLAVLLPTRRDLAHALARVAGAGWPLSGASDHLVSEALYLSDPDGNGIELYHDRPREDWTHDDAGAIRMATLALDVRALLAEADGGAQSPRWAPTGTRIGHVHLQVSDIAPAESFYHGVLGFDVTVRTYPGALFVSAGGYHHHLGLNTWASAGASPPPPGAVGLRCFEVVLPDAAALQRVLARVREAGLEVESPVGLVPGADADAAVIHDPSGIAVVLRRA